MIEVTRMTIVMKRTRGATTIEQEEVLETLLDTKILIKVFQIKKKKHNEKKRLNYHHAL